MSNCDAQTHQLLRRICNDIFDRLLIAELRHDTADEAHRAFEHHAVGLSVFILADFAARRVRRMAVDAGKLHRKGIRRTDGPAAPRNHDRVAHRHAVQVVASRELRTGIQVLVPAEAFEPLAVRCIFFGKPRLHNLHDVLHVPRRIQICRAQSVNAVIHHVQMRIDEARQHVASSKVRHAAGRAGPPTNVGGAAQRFNFPICNEHGFVHAVFGVQSPDVPVYKCCFHSFSF